MSEFIQTQEQEIRVLTDKVNTHFNRGAFNGKSKKRYQKLLENRMISQEYLLKDSCNVFSKKQIDEQFFVTLPDLKEIYETEKRIINRWQEIAKEKQLKNRQLENAANEKMIVSNTHNSETQEGEYILKSRRSTLVSGLFNLEKKENNINSLQQSNNMIETDYHQQSQHFRRQSIDKNSLLVRNSIVQMNTEKTNYGKMPTYSDYQKLKLSNQLGFTTFHSNLYSTFYETPKLDEGFLNLHTDKQNRQKRAHTTAQKDNTNYQPSNQQMVTFPSQRKNTNDHLYLQSRKESDSADIVNSFYNETHRTNNNEYQLKNFINSNNPYNTMNSRSSENNKEKQKISETPNNLTKQPYFTQPNEDFKQKFDKFKYINKIDLEMGINYSFQQHISRLNEDKETLHNFQNHIINSQLGQPNNNTNNPQIQINPWDSKNNLSLNSKHMQSQIYSKGQFNSKMNVSKTNALSSSQLSVKDGRLKSKRKKNEDITQQHISSQTLSNPAQGRIATQMTTSAVIEAPTNVFMKNRKQLRQSILPIQQSQTVLQNFNFPLQFLTSLSREESTKINTVQSFFPDFLNNLRFLEKSKQTKKRAARALKKILGWSDKMAPIILNEDGTEIKKDLDFQTAFFEEVIKSQKANTLKEISSNKKDSGHKPMIPVSSGLITLSFDAIWENFQKYQYLNKNLIEALERKEKEVFKQFRNIFLEEIVDIHKLQQKQLNKFPLSNKQYQFLITLPNNISHILERKNYLQKEQALDNLEVHEINLGQFPFLLSYERVRSKYINQCHQVIRNYDKHV